MRADVVILGGGAVGLGLAKQLADAHPGARVAVADRGPLPRPRDTLRLGESTSESAAWYLGTRLGLEDHLRAEQVPKLGLRFFLADRHRRGLAGRPEVASMRPGGFWSLPFVGTRPRTWQLHRGRLEACLAERAAAAGVMLLPHHAARAVSRGSPHRVTLDGPAGPVDVHARWVVDAAGGAPVPDDWSPAQARPHAFRVSWGWVEDRLDPHGWSDDEAYCARTPPDVRWRSTVHLVGDGWWVWLIPLGSGQHSVGVVADPARHPPLADRASFAAWAGAHEPDLARALARTRWAEGPYTREVRSWRADTILHPGRLAKVGDAAGFLDPMYSPGLDLASYTNELAAAAIAADLAGEDPARACRWGNLLHQRLHAQFEPIYLDLYRALLGNPRVMSAKIAWDNVVYFSSIALWMRAGVVGDPAALLAARELGDRVSRLQGRMQPLFRQWAALDDGGDAAGYLDTGAYPFVGESLRALQPELCPEDVRPILSASLGRLERWAVAAFDRAARSLPGGAPAGALNPYAVGLDPARWEEDGLTRGRARVEVDDALRAEARPAWLEAG